MLPSVTDLTVIIPTYNRADDLRRCLDALAQQTARPESFEVVVVDDGSTDHTAELLSSYTAPYRLAVARQPNSGQTSARNRGIELARSPYCLFLDDDIVAGQELVSEHLRAQNDVGGAVVIGALSSPVKASGGLARYVDEWWTSHYRRLDQGSRKPDFRACYSGNLSAPTGALRAAGGFDTNLSRSLDVELAYRLVRSGLNVEYRSLARGEHRSAKSFRQIVRDFDLRGVDAAVMYRRHPRLAEYPPLGDFAEGGSRKALLRRALLALRIPVWPLALVDSLLARQPPKVLYDFLQAYCFWRGLRREIDRETWSRLTKGTVILTYHALAREGERATRYIVKPGGLRRQLAWLRRRGRQFLSLDEYVLLRRDHRLPPPGSVIVTFDDGYEELRSVALPILLDREVPATVFLVSGAMGDANRWDVGPGLSGRRLLSWEDAVAMRDAGITLGGHSISHPRLTDVSPDRAETEIHGSRAELEERLGPIRHFSYPYGKTSKALAEATSRAGFETASCLEPGPNGPAVPLNNLRRLEIFGTWSLPRFAFRLWLGQPLFKRRRGPGRS
jgi:glycosyltransferase involved in cell wall biosynthesis